MNKLINHRISLIILLMFALNVEINSQTFNGVGNLAVPPSGTQGITQSPCTVTGIGVLGGCVKIENVTIDLEHTWVGDIGILLIAPNGTFIELSTGNGGSADNFQVTVFDDDAPTNIVTGAPPYNGLFKPEGRQNTNLNPPYLNTNAPGTFTFQNTFDGINADGEWTLYINDFVAADVGTLNSWSITFTANGQNFTVDAGPDLSICAGTSVTLTANNTAPNPTSYSWSTGATTQINTFCCLASTDVISVTVTDQSGCTATDAVTIIVTPAPVGNPITITACEISGTGLSLFNLPNFNSSVGSGTINWYFDMALTLPIPNPSNLLSASTTVYATVTVGPCPSVAVPITLVVSTSNPALYDMDIVEDAVCIGSLFSVFFTLPTPGVYTYEYTLTCGNTTTTSFITTSTNPILFSSNVGCVLSISKITPEGGCPVTFSPQLTDNVSIIPSPTFTILPINICAGTTIDLLDYISVTPSSPITFHTSLPPTSANQLPSTIITPTSTVNLVAATDVCNATAGFPVVVIPGGIPFEVNEPICENVGAINLNQFLSPPNLNGTWSGQGVSGNFFNPIGLTGTVSITFDPTEICYDNGTVTFQISLPQTPILNTTQLCESASPISLLTLQDPLYNAGTWSGAGVSGTLFDPTNLSGNVTLTFTPTVSCANSATTVINILPNPQFSVDPNIIVCDNTNIDLSNFVDANPSFTLTYHTGSPATTSNLLSSSVIDVNGSATYYVKALNADGCFETQAITISATPGGTPLLGTETLCQDIGTYNLDFLNDPNVGPGVWSGNDVIGNILNITNQTGIINLTFTPDNACFSTANTTVSVTPLSTPSLSDTELCSASGLYNLSDLTDPNYINGSWTGPGVSNNYFDPSALSGAISLTFIPSDFCVGPNTTTIDVTTSITPSLGDDDICEDNINFDLTQLQDPNYPVGIWSGPGVTNNIFNATGQSGAVELVFIANVNCSLPVTTTIMINERQVPSLLQSTLCNNADPLDLTSLGDPNYLNGTWSGIGVANNIFNPEGLSGDITVNFVSSAECTLPASSNITVNSSPAINNLVLTCDPSANNYTVSFLISDGDASSYLVNGIPATENYTSMSILSGLPYNFEIEDANGCNQIILQGIKNCDCVSDPGTMSFTNSPMKTCASDSIRAVFNNNAIIDNDDLLLFVLHDGSGLQLGNIFGISAKPVFAFPSNGIEGNTYYISSMIGNQLPNGNIDVSDACFSISAGVPAIFYTPSISLNDVDDFCVTQCQDISISMTGELPYTYSYEIFNGTNKILRDTIIAASNTSVRAFCPNDWSISDLEDLRFNIVSANDKNCAIITLDSIMFGINPERISNVNTALCQGQSITINGNIYNELMPKGQEVILSTISGICDSIINVSLNFLPSTSYNLQRQICKQQSIIVNGTVYDQNRLLGTEIITNAVGCDSIINISLTLVDDINVLINPILCQGESIVVNGKTYNAFNPKGQEIILATQPSKCDSIINIDITFIQPKTSTLSTTLCQNETIIVNNKIYGVNNPTGQEIIKNGAINGCDSIINVNLNFKNEIIQNINNIICQEDEIIINGTIFNINKTSDTFILNGAATNGCDSIINVTIDFYPRNVDSLKFVLKSGESQVVNGVTFDKNNLEGLVPTNTLSSNGCNQYVYVIVMYELEEIKVEILKSDESCPNTNDGAITIDTIQGCGKYTLTINSEEYTISKYPFVLSDLDPGDYFVEIRGDNGCLFTNLIEIAPSSSKGFEISDTLFEKYDDLDLLLNVNVMPIPISVVWSPLTNLSCTECLEPTLGDIENDVRLLMTLQDELGCIYTQEISIRRIEKDVDIVFPNIFSPDGDGVNDVFTITNTPSQKLDKMAIYDRWGNLIFSKNIDGNGTESLSWDGQFDQKYVVPGVYMYVAQIVSSSGKTFTVGGDITIIE